MPLPSGDQRITLFSNCTVINRPNELSLKIMGKPDKKPTGWDSDTLCHLFFAIVPDPLITPRVETRIAGAERKDTFS